MTKRYNKILLVYPPFCTPCSPPYSITNIYSFLKENLNNSFTLNAVDLNVLFHKLKFPKYQEYFKQNKQDDYPKIVSEYKRVSDELYSTNSKIVLENKNPDYFSELLDTILKERPDIVCFSIVYSSQVHYTYALIKELKKRNIKTIVGGPSVSEVLKQTADEYLKDEYELLEYITKQKIDGEKIRNNHILDFSIYNFEDYFVPEIVLPIKTTISCPHAKCAFCTHHRNEIYREFDLNSIKDTLKKNKTNFVFIIDDMLTKKRAMDIAELFESFNIKWLCQLRPSKEFDLETFQKLKKSGCEIIFWGVESGNDRILQLMKKGTNVSDIKTVLQDSHDAKIKNAVYIMFGFPSETKEECLKSISFLKENSANIDLISCSTFGLQKESDVLDNPQNYEISNIITTKRTLLDDSILYSVKSGLSQKEANDLRKRYKKVIEKISKFPKEMTYFREHMLISNKKIISQ